MSKEKAQHEIPSFADEIGIMETAINTAGSVMQLCMHANIPVLLIGASSTAKTAKVREIAAHNDARVVIYSLASKEAQDLTGPQFPRRDGTFTYLRDGQVPVLYEPVEEDMIILESALFDDGIELDDFRKEHTTWEETFREAMTRCVNQPALLEKIKPALLRARSGERSSREKVILFIDEVNRGSKDALNAAMPIWAERKLGTKTLGPNVRVIAAMNPPNSGYAVNSVFSTDSAMRRRLVQVGVKFNGTDFSKYRKDPAKSGTTMVVPPVDWDRDTRKLRKFHATVNKFLDGNIALQYDEQNYLAGKVYGCPATWEYCSWLLYAFDAANMDVNTPAHYDTLRTALAGCVGLVTANDVMLSYTKHIDALDPFELLTNFSSTDNAEFVSRVGELLDEGHNLIVTEALTQAARIFRETRIEDWAKVGVDNVIKSLAHIFFTVPLSISRVFLTELHGNTSPEEHQRVHLLFTKLPKYPDYVAYMVKAREAATLQQDTSRANAEGAKGVK